MVRLLLDAGASVSARDENGDSYAHFAVSECVQLAFIYFAQSTRTLK